MQCGIKNKEELKVSLKQWSDYRTKSWSQKDYPKEYKLVTNIMKEVKTNTLESLKKANELREDFAKFVNDKKDKTGYIYKSIIENSETQLGVPEKKMNYEEVVDSYESAKKALIDDINREEPRIRPTKAKYKKAVKKSFEVQARVLDKPEKIDTVIDGVTETTNQGKKGDYVLTGPKKEEYIISPKEVKEKYTEISNSNGKVLLKTKPSEIKYQLASKNMEFEASWGEKMIANKGDILVYEKGKLSYRIEKNIFKETYEEIDTQKIPTGYVVPIKIGRIVGKTAYYTYNNSKKVYSMAANSKNIKLKNRNLDTMIKEFAEKEDIYEEISLFNTEGVDKKNLRGKEVKEYIHGDPQEMKNMLDKIQTMSGDKASSEMMNHYKSLIDNMNPDFFRNLKLFITKNAPEPSGFISHRGETSQMKIGISPKPLSMRNGQTDAEVYMHEVIHSMVMFARRSDSVEARRFIRELEHTFERAKDIVIPKDFEPENATKEEKEEAKKHYEYVFNSKNAIDEFIAYALTNPMLKAKLENTSMKEKEAKTWLEKIGEMWHNLVDVILGNTTFDRSKGTVYDSTEALVFELAEINKDKEPDLRTEDRIDTKIMDLINQADDKIYAKIMKLKEKLKLDDMELPMYNANDNVLKQAAFFSKMIITASVNEKFRKGLGFAFSEVGIKPSGELRRFFSDFLESDPDEVDVEWLGLKAGVLDAARKANIDIIKKLIKEGFGKRITKKQNEIILRTVIDTDLGALMVNDKFKGYTTKELINLLEKREGKKSALETKIGRIKHKIEKLDPENRNWNITQAEGLGWYMLTHEGHIAQNLNAYNIASGVLSSKQRDPFLGEDPKKPWTGSWDLIDSIDELATLVALRETSQNNKDALIEMLKDKKMRDGIKNAAKIQEGLKKEARKTIFKNQEVFMIKGYVREVFNPNIGIEVAPTSQAEELEELGYEKKFDIENISGIGSLVPLSVYVTDKYGKADRVRGAVRLLNKGSKGTTLKQSRIAAEGDKGLSKAYVDIIRLSNKADDLVEQIEKGEFDKNSVDYGVIPLLDPYGNVVDYRYTMNKESKADLLEQDTDLGEVLGKTNGNIRDKQESKKHHKKVVDYILSNMKENWTEGNMGNDGLTPYFEVGPEVETEEGKEIYKMLPAEFKEAIHDRKDKRLAIPDKLKHDYFGYSQLSLANAPVVKTLMNRETKRIIHMFEKFWGEFIKIVKANILIKTPVVLIGNIISNIAYKVNTGMSFSELFNLYKESLRDVLVYMKDSAKYLALHTKEQAGTLSVKEENRLKDLKRKMEENPVHKLILIGLHSSIEDGASVERTSNNKIKQFFDEKLEDFPSIIKKGASWLFLTSDTPYYKFNQKVLELSDLVARDVMNRKLKLEEKKVIAGQKAVPFWWAELKKIDPEIKKKMTASEAKEFLKLAEPIRHNTLLKAFINYPKPTAKFEEYLNRMGPFRFTKFVKRVQRVVSQTATKHPLKTLGTLFTQQFLLDYDSIQDQSIFSKDWYTNSFGPGNIFPFYSFLGDLENGLEPALIKKESWMPY